MDALWVMPSRLKDNRLVKEYLDELPIFNALNYEIGKISEFMQLSKDMLANDWWLKKECYVKEWYQLPTGEHQLILSVYLLFSNLNLLFLELKYIG